MSDVVNVLVVDNDTSQAASIAQRLSEYKPERLGGAVLQIELCNTAYYVADQVTKGLSSWHIIFADVYMSIPSPQRDAPAALTANKELWGPSAQKWPTWLYNYSWNYPEEGDPKHGGIHIAREIKTARQGATHNNAVAWPKLVLVSSKISGESYRLLDELFQEREAVKDWLAYYSKADWVDATDGWSPRQAEPDVFLWALRQAIADRNAPTWGKSAIDPETHLALEGNSRAVQNVLTEARKCARFPGPILITGEPGTRQLDLARWLHKVKWGTVRKLLYKIELSPEYTALDDLERYMAAANGGTLFFEEIGKSTPQIQSLLLKLFKDREYSPAGCTEPLSCPDLFFICSTSKSLVKSDFHPEFFKLITPLRIPMPPLRERKEDIVSIACAILKSVHSESRKEVPLLKLEKPARHWLENQRWGSGNIEELAWVVKCASNRCTGDSLAVDDLICCQQEIIELEQPSSELIGTIAAPLPQKPETPAMVKGPFQFDIAANKLLIRGGRMLDVPQRFSEVLSSMMTKSGLGHSGRLSALTYAAVASLFEKGKLQEEKRDLTEAQRQKLLKGRKDRIERQQKEIAQEFSRQFSKWLRRNKVDPHSVFKCNRKSKQYQLSFGWKQGRMVLGDSQVRGGGDRGRNIEDLAVQDGLDEPAEDHESPGTADDDPDGCEND